MKKHASLTFLGLFFCHLLGIAHTAIPIKENNSIRIMCYNIRNAVGLDNKQDYDRIASIINHIQPDIVAIQELDSVTLRNGGINTLQLLGQKAWMHPTFGSAISYQGGKYGVGILSREKPLHSWNVPLPGREEERTLLFTEFADYVLACTHFSLTPKDQLLSIPIIIQASLKITKPLFLAGDMNSSPESDTQKEIRRHFKPLNNQRKATYPANNPTNLIDYIYTRIGNHYTLLQQCVLDEPIASDHAPFFVDVRLKSKPEAIFRTSPYLQNPTNNGITISWQTNVPVHSWVEYGITPALGSRAEHIVDGQVICNNKHHKIRLQNLEPDKKYYYRVCSREITLYGAYQKEFGETAYSTIHTLKNPGPDSDFTTLIMNDLHKNNQTLDLLMEQVKSIQYDFVIFNGDCIDDPKDEEEAIRFLSYMNEKVNASCVPVFYLRGNHEIRNAYSIQLRDLFDYVEDKTYGAFNWGDTRFVMLDCGEDKPDSTEVYYNLNNFESLRLNQVQFLKKELSGKAFKKASRRILLHHIPIYGADTDKYNPCRDLWHPYLTKAPFDICINAHTHRFSYIPKVSNENNFPIIIGGGYKPDRATIMVLQKQNKKMTLSVYNAQGKILKQINM